jgi:hypothetical protein
LFCIVENQVEIQEKTSRLRAVSSTIGMLISNNDSSNFEVTTKTNQSEIINKIGMNNDRLRKVFDGISCILDIIYVGEDRVLHAHIIAKVLLETTQWIAIRDALRNGISQILDHIPLTLLFL